MKATISLKGKNFIWEVENGKCLVLEAPAYTLELMSVLGIDTENGLVFVLLRGLDNNKQERVIKYPIDLDRAVEELYQDCEAYYECVTEVEIGCSVV